MISSWSLTVGREKPPPDVVLVGTDPIMSVFVAPRLRRKYPTVRIAHWCFDLYPEALVADGMLSRDGAAARTLTRMAQRAYRSCDCIADIGPCMRERLDRYGHQAARDTLPPWALWEPPEAPAPDEAARKRLFGTHSLGLLYSGSFGRGHSHGLFLELAEHLHDDGVGFCFSVGGNRASTLQAEIAEQPGVRVVPLSPEKDLGQQLAAGDIHMVSIGPEWSGIVVPSKFFAALAAGRPVLFSGPRDSSIARWIGEYGVGWVLDENSLPSVAVEIRKLKSEPGRLRQLQAHCHAVYRERFSREKIVAAWDNRLRSLVVS
jgi:hypothetical protein